MTDETDTPAEEAGVDDVAMIWKELEDLEKQENEDLETDSTEPDDGQPADAVNHDDTTAPSTDDASEEPARDGGTDQEEAAPVEVLDDQIQKLEHKVSSEEGRANALAKKDRTAEAEAASRRVAGFQRELSALKKSRERLAASASDDETMTAFREEYPQFAKSFDDQRASQEEVLAAREETIKADYTAHVRQEHKALLESYPEYFETVTKNADELRNFVRSGQLSVQDLQGFQENYSAIVNAASAGRFMDAFQNYLSSKEQTPVPQTDEPAAAAQAADAPEQTERAVVQQTTALDDKRRRQRDGASSMSSQQPGIKSTLPSNGSVEDDWAYWERRDRAKGR